MHAATKQLDISRVETFGSVLGNYIQISGIIGVIGLGLSVFLAGGYEVVFGGKEGAPGAVAHLSHSYLINFWFFLSISLGALFFTALQHVTRSGWSVVLRRIMEIIAQGTLPLAVLFLPILFSVWSGDSTLYIWNDPKIAAEDHLIHGKSGYLNSGFFAIRCIFYFFMWIMLARWFLNKSSQQDQTGEIKISNSMERMSTFAIPAFALTITFAAFDWLMSLDPHWFSTIWGVYVFAGSVISFTAFTSLLIIFLNNNGKMEEITIEHRHEVGRAMFFGICFWAYIAFSQYLLYWYANIPEETSWFLRRQNHGYEYVAMILIFGHFAIPFLGVISRNVKRSPSMLTFWAVYMLVMHWIDIYWLVMPEFTSKFDEVSKGIEIGMLDLTTFVGIGGIWLAGILYLAQSYLMIPIRDPRLKESLNFHNL